MARDILLKSGEHWISCWRAGPLEPGYGPYALNAVDSFFKVLDTYIPNMDRRFLRAFIQRYVVVIRLWCSYDSSMIRL